MAHVVDVGLSAANDDEILEYATAIGWLVISHDVNTMKAAAERRLAKSGELSL